jgi:hypothetical protein
MTASRFRLGLWGVRGCLVLSALLLGVGLAGPCMTIQPAFGAMDGWVRLFKPDLARPTSYSVVGGILALLRNGSTVVGVTLLAFSVLFPTAKTTHSPGSQPTDSGKDMPAMVASAATRHCGGSRWASMVAQPERAAQATASSAFAFMAPPSGSSGDCRGYIYSHPRRPA